MKKVIVLMVLFSAVLYNSCKKEDPYDYTIEYQDGYPSKFTGSWNAFDFSLGSTGSVVLIDFNPYNLITALDPNTNEKLILDNVYNSSLRVRADLDQIQETFYVEKGDQLESANAIYKVEKITLIGFYDDCLIQGFAEEFDVETKGLNIFIGLYDEYGNLFDSIYTYAARKTGFEDLDQYKFD